MVKRTQATAQALTETKEGEGLFTSDFMVGAPREKKEVKLGAEQPEVMKALELRKRVTSEKPPEELSELDRYAEEIFVELDSGKSIDELSRGHKSQLYLVLRELVEIKNPTTKGYFEEIKRAHKTNRAKDSAEHYEKLRIQRTIDRIEMALTGRKISIRLPHWLGAGDISFEPKETIKYRLAYDLFGKRPKPRELLTAAHKTQEYLDKGLTKEQAFRKAAADIAGAEIAQVLGRRAEEIEPERIETAEQSSNPADKKWARVAEKLPELIQQGVLKRKEIAGWDNGDDLRKFLGVSERELSNIEIIISLVRNNPDIRFINRAGGLAYAPVVLRNRIANRDWEGVERYLNDQRLSPRRRSQRQKRAVNRLIRGLTRDYSVDTVLDTCVDIVDSKLPAAEIEKVPKPDLAPETIQKVGEGELAVLIADGLEEQELMNKGFTREQIDNIKGKFFYKDAAGQSQLREGVAARNEYDDKRNEALRDLVAKYPDKVDPLYQRIAEDKARKDHEDKIRGEPRHVQRLLGMVNNNVQARYGRNPNYRDLRTARAGAYSEFVKEAENQLIDELKEENLRNDVWKESDEVKARVGEELIKTNPEIAEEFNSSFQYMLAKDLAGIGPENVAILKGRGILAGTSLTNVENALRAAGLRLPDVIDATRPTPEFKEEKEIVTEMLRLPNRRKALLSLAIMIFLGITSFEGTLTNLYQEGESETADELESLVRHA